MTIFLLLSAVLLGLFTAFIVSRWLWRRGVLGRVLLIVAAAGMAWSIYDAIHPSESFYTVELNRLVQINLPSNGEFLEKTATFPDHFGDYSACFIVRFPPDAISNLRLQLGAQTSTSKELSSCGTNNAYRTTVTSQVYEFDLTSRSTREDAVITVSVAPNENLAKFTWYLW